MNKKKKTDRKPIIIVIIILIALMLGLSVSNIKEDNKLNFFEKAIKDSTNYVLKIASIPFNFIDEKITMIKDTKNLYKKYTKLKEKVEKTELYYAEIEELQKEVTELKSVLELNSTLSEYTYTNATIINRQTDYWNNTLTIDKGSKNGIKQGDAVIVSKGLIGKIVNSSNFTSSVKLLTSDEITNKISVKIKVEDGYVYGLFIGYDKDNNIYKIEGIEDCSDIKEGDSVTTTGITDSFPSGILIGKVKKVVKDEYDLTSQVEVIPSVNFNDMSIVTVLKRKANK